VRGTPYQMELTHQGKIYKNTEAEEVLKSFDIEYYADLIFSMQSDDYKDITQLSPTQRSNYLQRLLNFDFIKEKEKLKEDLNNISTQQNSLKNDVSVNEQLKQKEQTDIEKLIEITVKEDVINSYKQSIEDKRLQIERYQTNQRKSNLLKTELADLNLREQILEKNEAGIKLTLSTIRDTKQKLTSTETELQKVIEQLTYLRSEQTKYEEDGKRTADKIQSVSENLIKYTAIRDEIERQFSHIVQITDLHDQKICPTCGQSTESHTESVLAEKKAELTRYMNDYGFEIATDDTFDGQVNIHLSFIKLKLNSIENALKNHKTDQIMLLSTVATTTAQIDQNERYRDSCDATLNDLDYSPMEEQKSVNQLDEIDTQLKHIIETKIEVTKQIEEIDDSDDLSNLSNEIIELTNKVNAYNTNIKTNEEIKKRNEKRQANIQKYTQSIADAQEQLGQLTSQYNTISDAYNILDKTLPNYMVIKTCNSLQDEMNSFIQNIFPNYAVKLVNSKRGCEFFYTKDNTIVENEKKRNNAWINSKMSSGLEKVCLTLAFKISLSKLYGVDLLLLDEADGPGDDDSSEKLFANILDYDFTQVFLISHKSSVKDFISQSFGKTISYSVTSGVFILEE
jgi:DNA repair exonuclease SbcCD ATPase subunit